MCVYNGCVGVKVNRGGGVEGWTVEGGRGNNGDSMEETVGEPVEAARRAMLLEICIRCERVSRYLDSMLSISRRINKEKQLSRFDL